MNYDYLMYIASILFFTCYIPELYANWKNKNANMYNIPEKIMILIGSLFALSYAILNENIPLIANYGPILTLDIIALVMRGYYAYYNLEPQVIYIQDDVVEEEKINDMV
jgi:uncharacterized protein with PQ loop repeat